MDDTRTVRADKFAKILKDVRGERCIITLMMETGQPPINGIVQTTKFTDIFAIRTEAQDHNRKPMGTFDITIWAGDVASIAVPATIALA